VVKHKILAGQPAASSQAGGIPGTWSEPLRRLAEMRKRRDMTQEQVAMRMGVSVARISQIESGDVSTQVTRPSGRR
jgi:hypothetical protein